MLCFYNPISSLIFSAHGSPCWKKHISCRQNINHKIYVSAKMFITVSYSFSRKIKVSKLDMSKTDFEQIPRQIP